MLKHCFHGFVVVLFIFLQPSYGGIVTAVNGWFTGTVSISGAGASETKEIEQSTTKGGTFFTPIGTLTTDASGDATKDFSKASVARLLNGHNVRVICPGGVICGPVKVDSTIWKFSFEAGTEQDVSVEFQQGFGGLLETWEPGAQWTLRLNASEANWVVNGPITISSAEGDVLASLVGVTNSDLTFEILSDASPLTPNAITIDGLGLNVPSASTLLLTTEIGLLGSVNSYYNGTFLNNQSFLTQTFVEAPEVSAPGDFDFNGDVNGADFLVWQRGESPNPLSQSDLSDWEVNFGSVSPLSAASMSVPVPSTGILLVVGLVSTLAGHRWLVRKPISS